MTNTTKPNEDADAEAFAKAADPNIEPWHLPGMSCAGYCAQGRKVCPHPKACEEFNAVPVRELLCALLWPVGLIGTVALVVFAARAWPWW